MIAPATTVEEAALKGDARQRILIVDDYKDSALMLAEALRWMGHDTCIAGDSREALELAATFAPAVAFLDIGLPVVDGYELAERLRWLPGLQNIRLVAVTGYGGDTDRQRSQAAGFHAHLVKPLDFEQLRAVLRDTC